MSWEKVEDWLAELECVDVPGLPMATQPGAERLWLEALSRIAEGLEAAASVEGEPYRTATFVAAGTAFTAPLEWVALLLGHGTRVVLKHPTGRPGAALAMAEVAQALGLPLTATDDRAAAQEAELVIAMGSDETMDALRASLPPSTTALLFGHRFSAAWVGADAEGAWADVAEALWPYDSRGCMSPQVVFTPVPLEQAVDGLARAMARAQRTHPRGLAGHAEAATIRARGALARITGVERHDTGWAVHGFPARHWSPGALPRCVSVVHAPDRRAAAAVLEPWSRWLSTVGDDGGAEWFTARVCPIRQMQQPPLDRLHDGVDVLRSVVRTGDWSLLEP